MGYVENRVKYRFANGESVRAWCKRNGASYVVALKLFKEGKSEKEIKKYLKKRYQINSIHYLVFMAKTKYEKARSAKEIGEIRKWFFSHALGEQQLSKAWDKVVLTQAIELEEFEIWKPIKNTNFEVSDLGRFRKRCKTLADGYVLMNAYRKQRRNKKGEVNRYTLEIKITSLDGTIRTYSAPKLVATHFVDNPHGYKITYLKNGDWQDIRSSNIAWVSSKQHGRLTGYSKKISKEVMLLDDDGTVIETYRSARAAAEDLFVSYQTVLDICNDKIKGEPLINVKFKEEKDVCKI